MASNIELIKAYLDTDIPLDPLIPGQIWTYPLDRLNADQVGVAFNADTGHVRSCIVLTERSPVRYREAIGRSETKHPLDIGQASIRLTFYVHAVTSGKDAGRQAMYRTKVLLDDYKFISEAGFIIRLAWRGGGLGWIDDESFHRTLYDYVEYDFRTRMS